MIATRLADVPIINCFIVLALALRAPPLRVLARALGACIGMDSYG